ncbi:MAG: murein transglycosylase A [Rhodospirillales bacterium]|nr:murein transglycosylase A [Rhodospirillales bacterium]MCB9996984.1 murein transglycosylase A [Rhodospirillales bacterium]
MLRAALLTTLLFLSACSFFGQEKQDTESLPLVLKPAAYSELPGWDADSQDQALAAFARSCARILKREAADDFGPVGGTYGDWQAPCAALPSEQAGTDAIRSYFQKWFTPWKAGMGGGEETGLFTGYYEPLLRGSAIKTPPYTYPLYARPDDLVMVDLGAFRDELKGQRIAGRVVDAHLKPYEDRAAIDAGSWPHNDKALLWVDDPVDAFFLHIQGSGRVQFPDGSAARVGYDGQNGHVYYAIGRELIKRGALEKDKVSLQTIRAWLAQHPEQANEIMHLNRSYVFFKMLEGDGPLGGEGLALTPERSLAIDRSKLSYGIPLWVAIDSPVPDEPPLRRLMVAQDTGGAIRGAVRGDVFWGHSERAEYLAGHMKAKGQYWLLLPKTITP